MRQKNNRTALMCATDFLARQDHSESRLRQKLKMRDYSPEDIEDAISKLKKYNYLNDQKACSAQFDLLYSSNKFSMRQIYVKLIKLGFDSQLIESLIPSDNDEHEKLTAVNLLHSKFKTAVEDKKMWQFLATKGFESSVVYSAVDEFKSSLNLD